jgi:hypothetical protein
VDEMNETLTLDSLTSDSLALDSLAVDSSALPVPGEIMSGLLIDDDVHPTGTAPMRDDEGMSWIFLGIVLLFCIIGLRFRNSFRYLRAILSDITQTRTRQNAFDDTVNETSFMLLLNLLWVTCSGVILWFLLSLGLTADLPFHPTIPDRPVPGIAICIGVSIAYLLVMQIAYWTVGMVFTDLRHTKIWMKGSTACYALCAILFFPLALLLLCYPVWAPILLKIAAVAFILCKIMFICQGFRIFFTQFSSWLLFLYYLCSLEVVPLIIAYVATLQICGMLL